MAKRIDESLASSFNVKELTPTEFNKQIETIKKNDLVTYLEAISDFCTIYDLDVKSITHLIDNSLRGKIEIECEELNLIKCDVIRLDL